MAGDGEEVDDLDVDGDCDAPKDREAVGVIDGEAEGSTTVKGVE